MMGIFSPLVGLGSRRVRRRPASMRHCLVISVWVAAGRDGGYHGRAAFTWARCHLRSRYGHAWLACMDACVDLSRSQHRGPRLCCAQPFEGKADSPGMHVDRLQSQMNVCIGPEGDSAPERERRCVVPSSRPWRRSDAEGARGLACTAACAEGARLGVEHRPPPA